MQRCDRSTDFTRLRPGRDDDCLTARQSSSERPQGFDFSECKRVFGEQPTRPLGTHKHCASFPEVSSDDLLWLPCQKPPQRKLDWRPPLLALRLVSPRPGAQPTPSDRSVEAVDERARRQCAIRTCAHAGETRVCCAVRRLMLRPLWVCDQQAPVGASTRAMSSPSPPAPPPTPAPTNMSSLSSAWALTAAAPATAEERCPVRWAVPGGFAFVASMSLIKYMRTTGAISPKNALPAYGAAFTGIGLLCYALK
jgi:hypothetical protein